MRNTVLSASIISLALGYGGSASAESWTWTLAPYAVAPFIDGDTSIGRLEDAGLSVDPTDIIDVLEGTFMGYVDGLHSSGWGFTLDYSFMDLGDSGSFAGGVGQADANVFQGILTAVLYRRLIAEPDRSLDVYGGVRRWDMDIDVTAALGAVTRTVEVKPSWTDPLIGVRYEQALADSKWSFLGQADVGGFGVNSSFAWTLKGGFVWQASDLLSIDLAYKAVGVDYEEGTRGTPDFFSYDTVTHGPYIGFLFTF